jgi:hypothetical protein
MAALLLLAVLLAMRCCYGHPTLFQSVLLQPLGCAVLPYWLCCSAVSQLAVLQFYLLHWVCCAVKLAVLGSERGWQVQPAYTSINTSTVVRFKQ